MSFESRRMAFHFWDENLEYNNQIWRNQSQHLNSVDVFTDDDADSAKRSFRLTDSKSHCRFFLVWYLNISRHKSDQSLYFQPST